MTDTLGETKPVQPADAVEVNSSRPALALRTQLIYGLGNVALNMKATLFGIFTLYLYTTVMGLPSAWVGIASALCLLWDAFIDPYIGDLSDRATYRFGRRHAPMLAGALTMGLGFWAYMEPPRGWSPAWLLLWFVAASLVVRTSMSLFGVPYLALGAELSDDYHERSSVTAVRGLLTLLGTMAAVSLSFILFFPERAAGVDPKLDYHSYGAMGLIFGICMSVCALVATVGTLSRRPYLRRQRGETVPVRGNLVRRFSGVIKYRVFILLVCSVALFFVSIVLNKSVYLYFMTYRAGVTQSFSLSLFEGAGFLGGILGVLTWLRVCRWVDKATVYNLGTGVTAVLMVGAHVLIGEGRILGTANVPVILAGSFLVGFFSSVVLFIPHSMLADIVDHAELDSGRRQEGTFFGVFSLCQQSATGIAVALGGVLLQGYVGLVAGQAEQSAETVHRIGILFGLIPAILLVLAVFCTLGYRLTRRRVGEIQQALAEQRATAPRTA